MGIWASSRMMRASEKLAGEWPRLNTQAFRHSPWATVPTSAQVRDSSPGGSSGTATAHEGLTSAVWVFVYR